MRPLFLCLDVRLQDRHTWQPACDVEENVVQAYFAVHGASVVEARKLQRAEFRVARRRFVGNWTSQSVISRCNCRTHKEPVAAVRTAYRSTGFLTMVTESGFIAGVTEIITAETLWQRYAFPADVANSLPEMRTVVHDDACHVRKFAKARADGNELAHCAAGARHALHHRQAAQRRTWRRMVP